MNVFEQAIERGEIDLGEYQFHFTSASAVAQFMLCPDNRDEHPFFALIVSLQYWREDPKENALRWEGIAQTLSEVVALPTYLKSAADMAEHIFDCALAYVDFLKRPGVDWNAYGDVGEV